MNIWQIFGTGYQKYIGSNGFARNFYSENIQLTINNKNIANLNFCSIDTDDFMEQKNVAKQYFDSKVLIYSSEKSQNAMSFLANEYNLDYIGTVPFLKKDSSSLKNVISNQENIKIKIAKNKNDLHDMIKIYENNFGNGDKRFQKMFSEKLLEEDTVNIYIAYDNENNPTSTVTTIKNNNLATIWGAVTQDNYKNNGIMTNLIDYAINYEKQHDQINEYYGIVISEQFNKMCVDQGATLVDRCHIWLNGGKE